MSHYVLSRVEEAPVHSTVKSSPTVNKCAVVNLPDAISSAQWDEVFEASDLVKFMGAGDDQREEQARNDALSCGDDTSASDVRTESCYSSTCSSVYLKQQSCGGDRSQLLYPSRLKIHAAKIALNSGKQHLTIKGQVRKARHLKNPCDSSCKRCEPPRLTASERQVVLDHFWSLKSHEKQWEFISNAVSVSRPKRKFVVKGSKGEKCWSRIYCLTIRGEMKRVCKTMFKNTLSICDSWIDSALSHVPKGLPDLRGRRQLE